MTLRDDLNEAAAAWNLLALQAERAGDDPVVAEGRRTMAARLRSHAEADLEGRLARAEVMLRRAHSMACQVGFCTNAGVKCELGAFLAEESKRTLGTP